MKTGLALLLAKREYRKLHVLREIGSRDGHVGL